MTVGSSTSTAGIKHSEAMGAIHLHVQRMLQASRELYCNVVGQ